MVINQSPLFAQEAKQKASYAAKLQGLFFFFPSFFLLSIEKEIQKTDCFFASRTASVACKTSKETAGSILREAEQAAFSSGKHQHCLGEKQAFSKISTSLDSPRKPGQKQKQGQYSSERGAAI